MSVVCELAAPFVANSAVDGDDVIKPFRHHASTCLRCQARHAAMLRTARELSAMEPERLHAPLDLEWRVMSSLEGDLAVPGTWRRPVAWSAAILSMAAAILIWRIRPRTSG
jgi:anti-sigma factor RsiW